MLRKMTLMALVFLASQPFFATRAVSLEKAELVSNADLQKIDAYGLPEGFKYVFESDTNGVKPNAEITSEIDQASGKKVLKLVSKNGKGLLHVVIPANLAEGAGSGPHYFLVKWRAKTAGDAQIYLDIDNGRERSRPMQSPRWITANVPLGENSPFTQLRLVFAAGKAGDTACIERVSVTALDRKEYRQCFVNNNWRIVSDREIAARPSPGKPAVNILANSSFELGPYSGMQISRVFRYKGQAYKGVTAEQSYHGKCAATVYRFQTIYYPFEPDKLYTISLYAKAPKEGCKLRVAVRSGCMDYLGNKYAEADADEAAITFPVTTQWQRYHFSFVTAPDPDPDPLKPARPRPGVEEMRLTVMTREGMTYQKMAPKSAFKVMMDEEKDGKVWVDAIQLEQGPLTPYSAPGANTCGVVLERSDTSDFCYYDDREIKAAGKVFTEDTTPRTLQLTYRITDFFGREVQKIDRKVATQGNKNIDDELTFLPPGRGLQIITLMVNDPQGKLKGTAITSMQQAFCAVSPLPRTRPFDEKARYGIHTPPNRGSDPAYQDVWPNEYERMRKLGVKWIRYMGGNNDALSWAFVEPKKGEWRWDDATLSHPSQNDFCVLGALYTAPSWLGGGWQIDGVEGHWDEWEEYVFRTVNRYKDKIKYWEIWNEPAWYVDTYSEMLKRASSAVRRADPEAKIVGFGGFSHVGTPKFVNSHPDPRYARGGYKGYFEGVLDKIGIGSLDIVSVHGYFPTRPEENWWPLSDRLEYLRGEMKKRGRMLPIWDSEASFVVGSFYTDRMDGADCVWNRFSDSGADPNIALLQHQMSPRYGANALAQKLAVDAAHGCEKFFYHFNLCAGGGMMDGNAGVLYEYDDSPKAHFAAWAAVALMLDRSSFVTEIKHGKDMRCYVYERNGVPTAAFWRLTGEPQEARSGTLTLACQKEKIAFFDIMSNPLQDVSFGPEGIAIPLTSDLAYIQGKGMSTKEFVAVLKGARRTGPVQKLIDWSSFTKPEAEAKKPEASVNRKEKTIVDCRPAGNIRIDGKPDDWQGIKPFEIKNLDQVVAGRPDPSMPTALQGGWRSEADLSGKLRVAWDQDNVYWAVLVKDDIVVENKFRGKPQAYLGDCVEIFFDGREPAKQNIAAYDDLVGQMLVVPASRESPQATITRLAKPNILSEMQAASTLTENGYFVEGRIPVRKLLPHGLSQGIILGFDLAIDDTDSSANRKTQMIWTGTANACADATVFGRLRLVD